MDLHVPSENTAKALATTVGYITDRLDAVVISHEPSKIYEGSIHLVLAGNDRDLATAAERASRIGGVVD